MKKQHSGTIVQFSSIGGRVGGSAGLGSYQAAKFAVDGLTRVLAAETRPFGIRCLVVEPSGFATDWAGTSMKVDDIPSDYEDTVGQLAQVLKTDIVKAGDLRRAAEILVRIVGRRNVPLHLLLGVTATKMAAAYSLAQAAEVELWRHISDPADFGQPYPVEMPADNTVKPDEGLPIGLTAMMEQSAKPPNG